MGGLKGIEPSWSPLVKCLVRRGDGAVERAGLENRNTRKRIVGSNPTLSASQPHSSSSSPECPQTAADSTDRVRTWTCGLTGLPPRRNAPFGVGERDSTPLHAKGGLEEFGRLVGDTAQSAGAMQVNHRGVAADAGFCRSAPGALRVSFASKSISRSSGAARLRNLK